VLRVTQNDGMLEYWFVEAEKTMFIPLDPSIQYSNGGEAPMLRKAQVEGMDDEGFL
jgi:hypothetical protein